MRVIRCALPRDGCGARPSCAAECVRARERPFKRLAFERSCEYEYARSGSVWVFATKSEMSWIEWKKELDSIFFVSRVSAKLTPN